MKKLVASLAASALLAGGLLVATGPTASAAPPYAPTVTTKVIVKTPKANKNKAYKVGQKIRLFVDVKTAGTAKPKGKVTLRYQRKNAAGKWVKVAKAQKNNAKATRKFNGKAKNLSIGFIKAPGKYRVVTVFKPQANTVFKKSKKTITFKVKR